MPVDRTLAQDLAQALAGLYQDAETRLAADIARRLAAGISAPDWAVAKLAALRRLRLWMTQLLRRLDGTMGEQVAQAIVLAYVRGGQEALDELARLQSTHPEWLRAAELTDPGPRLTELVAARTVLTAQQLAEVRTAIPGIEAIQRLSFSLVSKLRGAHLRITRWAEDAYREVVGRASQDVLLGTATRRRAAQLAWERLLGQGITGFVDQSGRRWNLASYVEMAVRSTVAQAAVEGHLDRLGAAGIDLVIVSDAPGECVLCRPWEGKVLSRTTPGARTVEVPHAIRRSEMVTVHVAGSVVEAVAAGLMHPNCRHSLSAYLPGVTRIPTHTEDPQGDADRQQLRHLERQLRSWKLREASVIDPKAHDKAKAKVREYQQRIRDHVAATGLIRQPSREQIDLGNTTAETAGRRAEAREAQRAAREAGAAAERERQRAQREAERAQRQAEAVPELPRRRPAEPPAPGTPRPPLGDLIPRGFDDVRERGPQIRQAFVDRLDGEYAGLRVKVNQVVMITDKVEVQASIFDANGRAVGSTSREFHRGDDDDLNKLWVYHAYLQLAPQVQGQGFAEAWNGRLGDWYHESGLAYIKVTANIDVGGYTWARHGFDWDGPGGPQTIAARLRGLLDRPFGEQQRQAAEDMLRRLALPYGDPDFPTPYEVSQVGRQPGQGRTDTWIGKAAMLGSLWKGIKWLR
jgi:hypothetical protein